ncbi:Mu-like prophage major head subunit gpT [Klebsiella pneumoniae subsp. ozaenae]|uniref:Mu-like prophage major head subunit gpT n=1 Tax=Klebsiella pneumoniae subsp. ozaenae TaxID=574 RepID=A0A377Z2M1_KLEPO|nr:Mu-like prophage major head subunit gpT [Klebsiella pneumoniae subsp. ozaenae]
MRFRLPPALNAYGFLEEFPEIKEWLADRQLKELSTQDYILKNKTFESSISIKREDFEDNDYGKYSMIFEPVWTESSTVS